MRLGPIELPKGRNKIITILMLILIKIIIILELIIVLIIILLKRIIMLIITLITLMLIINDKKQKLRTYIKQMVSWTKMGDYTSFSTNKIIKQ